MIDTGVSNATTGSERPGRVRPAERHDPTRCGALEQKARTGGDRRPRPHARVTPGDNLEVMPAIVQYQVRTARITDAERIVALLDAVAERAAGRRLPPGAGDLLRQLVGLPHAVVLVAESGRRLAGASVLALHPSVVLGGFVGTIDVLVVDPASPLAAVTDSLLEELLRSGRNKGCVAIEAANPADQAERDRWIERGFSEAGPRMVRVIAPAGARPG